MFLPIFSGITQSLSGHKEANIKIELFYIDSSFRKEVHMSSLVRSHPMSNSIFCLGLGNNILKQCLQCLRTKPPAFR